MNKAAAKKLGYVGSAPGSRDSNSWYTPQIYLDSARKVLGEIDLDPFSSVQANALVKAKSFYSEERPCPPGEEWDANTVWMNPPYSAKEIAFAVEAFTAWLGATPNAKGIVLTNNATDTTWWHKLANKASAVCFTKGRIKFWNVDNKAVSGNTRGQTFFFFGAGAPAFRKEFAQYGKILK